MCTVRNTAVCAAPPVFCLTDIVYEEGNTVQLYSGPSAIAVTEPAHLPPGPGQGFVDNQIKLTYSNGYRM